MVGVMNNSTSSLFRGSMKPVFSIQRIALFSMTAVVLGLSGCATSPYTYNEGSTRIAAYTAKNNMAGSIALYLSNVDSQNNDNIIQKQQAFSVHLLSAHICDFQEAATPTELVAKTAFPCPGGNGRQNSGTRGEIAIVVNIGERQQSGGLTFDPATIKSGRVIYYNEDVRQTGQLINAINLPVYGPKTYKGNPFYMDWAILELDNKENIAARKLLKQLADAGAVPAAPYTPVLKLLNALGGALIDANGDDVEMRYQMETDSARDCSGGKCSNMGVGRMPLREGYYAFIRNENRSDNVDTTNISICVELGVLCRDGNPWREKTWLLVRIAREDEATATAQDSAQNLAGLLDAFNTNSTYFGVETLKSITEAIKDILTSTIKAQSAKVKD